MKDVAALLAAVPAYLQAHAICLARLEHCISWRRGISLEVLVAGVVDRDRQGIRHHPTISTQPSQFLQRHSRSTTRTRKNQVKLPEEKMAPGRGSTPCHATGPEVRVHAFVDRNRQRDVSVQAVTRRQLAAIVVAREKRPEKRWDRRAQGVRSRVLNVSEYGGARVLISSCCTRTHEQEMRAQRCNKPQIENTSTSTPASAAAQQPTLLRQ